MRTLPVAIVFFLAALAPAWAFSAPSRVTTPTTLVQAIADDEGSIHAIISDQIEAFRNDDGEAAYAFAAPGLKLYFPTVEGFMAMVRNGYQPIYRARRFSFGDLKQENGKFVQSVAIIGPDGDSWRAVYTLARQDDGSLKIVSCYLIKDVTA